MTLPNPRTIYEIDPTGHEDRVIVSRGLRTSSGIETVCSCGLFQWNKVIVDAANRHVFRTQGPTTATARMWTGIGAPRHV